MNTFLQLLATIVISASLATYAQAYSTNLDEKIKNLAFSDTPVTAIIKELAQKAKIKVIFDEEDLGTISGSLNDVTVTEALLFIRNNAHLQCIVLDDETMFFSKEAAKKEDNKLQISSSSAKKPYLQGYAVHSEHLPSLAPELRVGAAFNRARLIGLSPNNRWVKLPSWSVGTWKSEHQTNYGKYYYSDGSISFKVDLFGCRSAETSGHQKDKLGGIWQYTGSDYWTMADLDSYISLHHVKEHEYMICEPDKFTIRFVSSSINVSKWSGRIIAIEQQESLQTYFPAGPNFIKCMASIKTFDRDGKPITLTQNLSFSRRIEGFSPWTKFQGRDLYPLFIEYLDNNNLIHLIPKTKTVKRN